MKELFPEQMKDVTAEDFYKAVNVAQPSLIRTEADELLLAAGYALSPVIAEDIVFAFCICNGIFDLFKVNNLLYENGLNIIPPK